MTLRIVGGSFAEIIAIGTVPLLSVFCSFITFWVFLLVFGGGGCGDVGFRNVCMSYIVNNDCNVLQL